LRTLSGKTSSSEEISAEPKIKVGVGGWAYLPIRHVNKLEVCARLYDFAEINSSYYKLPQVESAKWWRRIVPEQFEFTMRANRRLTHENHLKPSEENFRLYQKHLELCRVLNVSILHFQFPPSLEVTEDTVKSWRDFLNSTSSSGKEVPHLAFEIRSEGSRRLPYVNSFFREYDITPTEDASRESELSSSGESKIFYTRVFGQGYHTRWSFDSEELKKLEKKVEAVEAKKRYVTFHNFTMYEDASRMKNIVKTGKELSSSSRPAYETFDRTLAMARVKFPITKGSLFEECGWRTYEESSGQKFHLGKLLERLPEGRKFQSLEEILEIIHH